MDREHAAVLPSRNESMLMCADSTKLNIIMGGHAVLESDHFKSAGVQDMAWLDVVAELLRELSGESQVIKPPCICVCMVEYWLTVSQCAMRA